MPLTKADISRATRRGIKTGLNLTNIPLETDGWEKKQPTHSPGYTYPDTVAREGCGPAIRESLLEEGFPGENMQGMHDSKLASPGGEPGSIKNLVTFCWVTYNKKS
jgi:hypothetical protein